ncbi:MAG: triose-phosphate isomerase, partial [Planctomycetota bacterium]
MRRPFIAGNWKMNLTKAEAIALAQAVAAKVGTGHAVEITVCPPAVHLDAVAAVLKGTGVGLGAQNVYFQANGAFTGELSVAMLVDLGVQYVILGHSERRRIMGETNEQVNAKLHAVLAGGLTPIVCVGETLDERKANKTEDIVQEQLAGSLAGISAESANRVVIAYEQVWAIGTGQVANKEQAEEVHSAARKMLAARFGATIAAS